MLVLLVLREAVLRLVEVGGTAVNTKAILLSEDLSSLIARAGARSEGINVNPTDPAIHPAVGREPAGVPGEQVGEIDTTVIGAKRDPWGISYSSGFAMLQLDGVLGVVVQWDRAGSFFRAKLECI